MMRLQVLFRVISVGLLAGTVHGFTLLPAGTAIISNSGRQRTLYLPNVAPRSRPRTIPAHTPSPFYSKKADETEAGTDASSQRLVSTITSNPARSVIFSILMTASGAALGPFLDSFHSAFGVLQYDAPITATLWGIDAEHPSLITAWWVPELFGLAGFIIGWLYILLDVSFPTSADPVQPQQRSVVVPSPLPPKILVGIAYFTFQYWLSGILFQSGLDRTTILNIMSIAAASGFLALDNTFAGFLTSAATALGGPLIEVGLLTLSKHDVFFHGTGYHYTDLGETGFFPLWIVPVYFLGGPANGNLARGYWTALGRASNVQVDDAQSAPKEPPGCCLCNDTRRVPCPNW
jgi:hypothetical protein